MVTYAAHLTSSVQHIKAPPSDRSIIHRRPCDWIVTGVTPIRDGPLLASCHFLLFCFAFFFIPTSSYNRHTEALQPRICYKTDVTALSVLISIFCLWLDTTRVAGENRANTVTHTHHRNKCKPHINIIQYTNVTGKIYM